MPSEKTEVFVFYGVNRPQIGDIIYWNGTDWVALPAGNEGQILSVSSFGLPEWKNPPV